LSQKDKDIERSACDCQTKNTVDIAMVVNDVVSKTGREKDKVILILQEVQKRLNYLPS
jgi:hypothetical protein